MEGGSGRGDERRQGGGQSVLQGMSTLFSVRSASHTREQGLKNAKGAKGGRVGVRDRAGFGADEE